MPDDDARSVFVDESGRRRTRTKNIARGFVAAAGIYVLLVIVGLTGSVSLPGVRLGRLSPALPKQTADGPLGPRSKIIRLPTATRRSTSTTRANASRPGDVTTTVDSNGNGSGQPGGPATSPNPTNPHKPTTTTHPKSPSTTTLPVTTTTKRRGPPTSTTHGPPSTKPGQGKGRT